MHVVIAVPVPMWVSLREKAAGMSPRRERPPKTPSWTTMAPRMIRHPKSVCLYGDADTGWSHSRRGWEGRWWLGSIDVRQNCAKAVTRRPRREQRIIKQKLLKEC